VPYSPHSHLFLPQFIVTHWLILFIYYTFVVHCISYIPLYYLPLLVLTDSGYTASHAHTLRCLTYYIGSWFVAHVLRCHGWFVITATFPVYFTNRCVVRRLPSTFCVPTLLGLRYRCRLSCIYVSTGPCIPRFVTHYGSAVPLACHLILFSYPVQFDFACILVPHTVRFVIHYYTPRYRFPFDPIRRFWHPLRYSCHFYVTAHHRAHHTHTHTHALLRVFTPCWFTVGLCYPLPFPFTPTTLPLLVVMSPLTSLPAS